MKFKIGKYTIKKLDDLNWALTRKTDPNDPKYLARIKKLSARTKSPTGGRKDKTMGYYHSLLAAKQELANHVALNDSKDYKELCAWIKKIKSVK